MSSVQLDLRSTNDIFWNVPQKMSLVDRKSSCTLDNDVKCPPGKAIDSIILRYHIMILKEISKILMWLCWLIRLCRL